MKQFVRKLRNDQTDAEGKLWYFLRNRQCLGFKFRRQHPIGSYIVDFCCVEKRLVIELDGSQHISERSKDELRTKELNKQGYQVLRFWDNEALKDTERVLERIQLILNAPHPNPLPRRERESFKLVIL
jgi:very-short-patch-repair endonuclease